MDTETSNGKDSWKSFVNGLKGFSDDFMEDGRMPDIPVEREDLDPEA